jgi:hypothetical protein
MKHPIVASVCVAVMTGWFAAASVVAQGGRGGQVDPAAAAVETPRDGNGHPVLDGIWAATQRRGDPAARNDADGSNGRLFIARKGTFVNFERDSGVGQRVYVKDAKPYYKPQFWERVKFNDVHGHNKLAPDPAFQCMPQGVPRIGFPRQIVDAGTSLHFLYPLHQRTVYMDGRPHPPVEQWLGTWFGHSVGHWEGDTLVISTVDFNGQEWMGWPGWYTSPDKEVVERITRDGNTVRWEATVTDPYLLMQPWTVRPVTRQLNTDPLAELEEPLPCLERDLQHMFTRERG